ncbi:hypothetical protein F4779DRAFT_604984 [Xylariaceae sp. FL0662B]|nr:hypothetical protein F4779DRAFT_604984 [Xylariaceae sp. FL0662B]
MFNALTLYHTDDEDWEPRLCPVTLPDGTAMDLNTWAPFLVGADDKVYDQFKVYSAELRILIARCMADDRKERPSLQELLDIIERNIAAGDRAAEEARNEKRTPVDVSVPPAVEDDDILRRFFQEYLREPPSRQDPYRDYWPPMTQAVPPPTISPGFPQYAFPPPPYQQGYYPPPRFPQPGFLPGGFPPGGFPPGAFPPGGSPPGGSGS